MGLDVEGTKFLLEARRAGASFARTAMVGRQSLLIDVRALAANLNQFGFQTSEDAARRILTEADGYAEPFLKILGAEEIVSFDASDYEKATRVHDFNQPISDEYKNEFSVVLDGGTLEHVFNFPAAIKNCMEMVEVGGHFLGIAPTNNYFGHGFYQFSPELFFRVFTDANGFETPRVFVFEQVSGADWYEVADPDAVRERVILVNNEPSLLLVSARKKRNAEIFKAAPQQSDYFAMWQANESGEVETNQAANGVKRTSAQFAANLPLAVLRRINRRISRRFGMLNSKPGHFKKKDSL